MHGPAPRTDAGHSSTKESGDAEVLTVNLVPAGLRSSSRNNIWQVETLLSGYILVSLGM